MTPTPIKVGLTGGIGSGKSTVAAMFAEIASIPVLDLDQVGRAIVVPGSVGLAQLITIFGHDFLQDDGALNRAALARYCFANQARTDRLNAIMHPLIEAAEAAWVADQQSPYVMIEASVLLESGAASRMDMVIAVLADETQRYERVMARGDRSSSEFYAIIDRQCNDETRRSLASMIIENMNSLEQLKRLVVEAHQLILQCFVLKMRPVNGTM